MVKIACMKEINITILCILVAISHLCNCFTPTFTEPVLNITVARGRHAQFTCKVKHLGGYRVGWVKADTKAIQAIHTHRITHNQRVKVGFDDHSTWHLHIKQVSEDDKGPYMCQINTDPMISQIGWLEVVTPPEIDDHYSSGDITVTEGLAATMRCVARGPPKPDIRWQIEDDRNNLSFMSDGNHSNTMSWPSHIGEVLEIPKVTREHMGYYRCFASNGVPPVVYKRIHLSVNFHPLMHVPNQLIGSPYGLNVTMVCNVEASPTPVMFWNNENDTMISNSTKYHAFSSQEGYNVKMTLVIIELSPTDIGDYKCVATNSIGRVESIIKINYIAPPTLPSTTKRPINQIHESGQLLSADSSSTSANFPLQINNEIWLPASSDPWERNPEMSELPNSNIIHFPEIDLTSGTSNNKDVILIVSILANILSFCLCL